MAKVETESSQSVVLTVLTNLPVGPK